MSVGLGGGLGDEDRLWADSGVVVESASPC